MPSFKVIKNHNLCVDGRSFNLKQDDILSETDFNNLFKTDGSKLYAMTCTDLKHIVEEVSEEISEEVSEEVLFLVNEDISVDDNITINKGDRKTLSELLLILSEKKISKLIKSKALMEIKISQNV